MAKIIPEEAYKVYLAYLDDITNSLDLITENLYSRRNQNFNELLQIREKLLDLLEIY